MFVSNTILSHTIILFELSMALKEQKINVLKENCHSSNLMIEISQMRMFQIFITLAVTYGS